MIIKILTRLEKRVDELSENLYKEIENIKHNKPKMKNTINEMKTTRENQQQITGC